MIGWMCVAWTLIGQSLDAVTGFKQPLRHDIKTTCEHLPTSRTQALTQYGAISKDQVVEDDTKVCPHMAVTK